MVGAFEDEPGTPQARKPCGSTEAVIEASKSLLAARARRLSLRVNNSLAVQPGNIVSSTRQWYPWGRPFTWPLNQW